MHLQNQNLIGSWASVDCFRCLNIACNDNNDTVAWFTLILIRQDNLTNFPRIFRYRLFVTMVTIVTSLGMCI